MAILGPADMPVVLKLNSDPIKKYVLSKLGYPIVDVELEESQFESVIATACDFVAGYFPREQRMAWFQTSPLVSTYPMPHDAYHICEVAFSPMVSSIHDVFGAEAYLFNVGNVTGLQSMLLDLHLLAAYRRFSAKILSTEGSFEVINETSGGGPTEQLIRLYPTPKGSYPVVVVYYPVVTAFRSPIARKLTMDMALAEAKQVLGASRRKITGMPSPDGGSIQYDGESLVQEGIKEAEDIILRAINLGEPLRIHCWMILPFLLMISTLLSSFTA